MKYLSKNVYSQLVRKYVESNKNLKNVTAYISECSFQEESICSDFFNNLDIKEMGNFLRRSTPILFFDDEIVSINVDGNIAEIPYSYLVNYQNKDFIKELFEDEEGELLIKISLLKKGDKRKEWESKLKELSNQYCNEMNKKIKSILKSEPSEQVIYLIECQGHESEMVFDGTNCVASGNSWDFHPGCTGDSYKKIKLGNYSGSGSLALILSARLKKKIKTIEVNEKVYDLFSGYGWDYQEKNNRNSQDNYNLTMGSLMYTAKQEEKEKKNQDLKKLQESDLTIAEFFSILRKEFGNKFSYDNTKSYRRISVKYGHYYNIDNGDIDQNFEQFVYKFKNFSLELGLETIYIYKCRI